jgi:membrane fusion protein, multidrug efflux system
MNIVKGHRVWKWSVSSGLLPAVIMIGLAATLLAGCGKEKKAEPQAPVVEVVQVTQKDVPVYAEWVGTLDGLINATIKAQVQGFLLKQNYKEGDVVRKDQALFEIDPREYQAALDQAKAGLNQSKGALDQVKAALERAKAEVSLQDARWTVAKANLARVRPLAEQNAVSKKDLDDAIGTELSTRSAVEGAKAGVVAAEANIVAAQAQVVAAQANVEKADLNLVFTKITSPVDGIAGIAKAQIGNLVGPGSVEELTTVSTVNPIKCYAGLSEQEYIKAQETRSSRKGKVPLDLILSDGSVYPLKGEIAFADRQVDVRTGTIRVAALFPNPQNLLRPGMFARMRAETQVIKGALLIPQQGVSEVQGKYLVAVVGPENKVAIKQVKVGQRTGELWVISDGLKAGEKVVAEGIQKVRDGMVVNPQPFGTAAKKESGPSEKAETKPEAKPQSEPEKR